MGGNWLVSGCDVVREAQLPDVEMAMRLPSSAALLGKEPRVLLEKEQWAHFPFHNSDIYSVADSGQCGCCRYRYCSGFQYHLCQLVYESLCLSHNPGRLYLLHSAIDCCNCQY